MIITSTVAASESQKEMSCSTRVTKVSEAKSSMAPCAKLNTPEAL
jgi:hypothetical protein